MKIKSIPLITLAAAALYGLTSCGDKHADDDHDHDKDGKHVAGDKDDHDKDGDDHDHDKDDHDHDHAKKAGPSGGRVMTKFEPHAEFFVLEDRKVRLTFVDDDFKPIPAADQEVFIIAGDRSAPTELSFTKQGDVLVSDKALPGTDDFPVIVQIAEKAGAEVVTDQFQANMLDCPSCDYLEYACTCDHGDEE